MSENALGNFGQMVKDQLTTLRQAGLKPRNLTSNQALRTPIERGVETITSPSALLDQFITETAEGYMSVLEAAKSQESKTNLKQLADEIIAQTAKTSKSQKRLIKSSIATVRAKGSKATIENPQATAQAFWNKKIAASERGYQAHLLRLSYESVVNAPSNQNLFAKYTGTPKQRIDQLMQDPSIINPRKQQIISEIKRGHPFLDQARSILATQAWSELLKPINETPKLEQSQIIKPETNLKLRKTNANTLAQKLLQSTLGNVGVETTNSFADALLSDGADSGILAEISDTDIKQIADALPDVIQNLKTIHETNPLLENLTSISFDRATRLIPVLDATFRDQNRGNTEVLNPARLRKRLTALALAIYTHLWELATDQGNPKSQEQSAATLQFATTIDMLASSSDIPRDVKNRYIKSFQSLGTNPNFRLLLSSISGQVTKSLRIIHVKDGVDPEIVQNQQLLLARADSLEQAIAATTKIDAPYLIPQLPLNN